MNPPSRATATVHAAAAGVSAHITWQLFSRVCSFLLRAVVVRTLGPERVAETELNVSLVVSFLILPISGFRKISLRVSSDGVAAALSAVCVSITSVCAVLCGAVLSIWRPDNVPTLAIVVASLCVRAAAEPHVIFTSRRERYAHNSRARACSVLVSGLASAIAVRAAFKPSHAAPAAAFGHFAYSVCMFFAMRVARGIAPVPFGSLGNIVRSLRVDDLHMAAVTTWQCFLKYILGNGESFVLWAMCPPNVQGAYFLAGNFASIVARFFNESLEDQCFNVFSRLSPSFRSHEHAADKPVGDDVTCDMNDEGNVKDAKATCIKTMHLALKAALLVAVLFALIGPAYAYSAVRVLYDVEWSEKSPAARLLSHYFVYLVFMSANGVTEAFFLSAAVRHDLQKHTVFSAFLSVAYIVLLSIAAKTYLATGIIAVNCLNMAVRTTYSTFFYCRLTKQKLSTLIVGAVPHPLVVLALCFARTVSLYSEKYFVGYQAGLSVVPMVFNGKMDVLQRVALHSFSGVFALGVFAAALLRLERPFLLDMRRLMRRDSPVPSSRQKKKNTANGSSKLGVEHVHAE